MSLRAPEPSCDSPLSPTISSPAHGAFILPETRDGSEFTLLSMNIQNRGYETGYPANRMACLSRIAEKVDITALQEDFQSGPQPRGLSRQSPGRVLAPSMLFSGNTSGLTLLSRTKPKQMTFRAYGACNGWLPDRGKGDCWARKGVQTATLDAFAAVNIHGEAGRTRRDEETRARQLLNMTLPLTGNLVISGDFNLSTASKTDEETLATLTRKYNLTIYYRSASKNGKDMILGRGLELVGTGVVPKEGLSDHDGLIARFRIPSRTAARPAPPMG